MASNAYTETWSIRSCEYPYVVVNVISTSGKTKFCILINLKDYNFRPPKVTIVNENLRNYPRANSISPNLEVDGRSHIMGGKNIVWFCYPGFMNYHDYYFPLDRWEHIRYTDEGEILTILNWACLLINRKE